MRGRLAFLRVLVLALPPPGPRRVGTPQALRQMRCETLVRLVVLGDALREYRADNCPEGSASGGRVDEAFHGVGDLLRVRRAVVGPRLAGGGPDGRCPPPGARGPP